MWGSFQSHLLLSSPQLSQAKGVPSIPDKARREPEMKHYKRDAFLPGNIKHQEILVWAGIVLCVRSLDVDCRDSFAVGHCRCIRLYLSTCLFVGSKILGEHGGMGHKTTCDCNTCFCELLGQG